VAHDAKSFRIETLAATLDVDVAKGEHHALRCDVDLAQRTATLAASPTRGA
jgi:hypothetical protein